MIDPEDGPPRLDDPPGDPPPEPGGGRPEGDGRQRRVAVLIMVVSLLGGIFAFLQTTTSNQAARATRRADIAAAEAMARLATGAGMIGAESRLWSLAYEDAIAAVSLTAAGGDDAGGLAQAYDAARRALLAYTDLALPQYIKENGATDWAGFVEEALAPSYRAAEYQKAYAAERDGWGAKGAAFVAMVTVLAVSLFLLGLSRTSVAVGSGSLLAGVGTALAAIAAVWGLVVVARPVPSPSDEAISAFVEGRVALNTVVAETDPDLLREGLGLAEEAFGRAVAARSGYFDAYVGRGTARFRLDFLEPSGPVGSTGARGDFARAVALNPRDAVAWGDLGAARFWLGELGEAGDATRRSLELSPDDLTFNMNLSLFLAVAGEAADFEEQWARVGALAAADDVPAWLRSYNFTRFDEVLGLAAGRFPEYAAVLQPLRERARRLDHQIAVGKRFYDTPAPAAVAVQADAPAFDLSADGTRLVATFAVRGVASGQSWLWRTYRGGVEDAALSAEPQAWSFGAPDEPALNLTLDLPGGFAAGVPVRVELFFDGYLVQAGEFTP